jgi:MscS family membrane protein
MSVWGSYVWGNPLSSYFVFLALVFGSFAVARVARAAIDHYAMKWAEKTDSRWDDVILRAVSGPATWLVAIGGAVVGKEGLILTQRAELWADRILTVCAITVMYAAMYKLFRGGAGLIAEEYVKRTTKEMDAEAKAAETKTTARITRQINEIAGMVIVVMAILTALSNLGVDLKAIWASLGIGGLALALAVKEPMANLVGRMEIYSTGLFDEGHVIQIDNWVGTVTKIGTFRTYIELLSDMSTVAIPNSEFSRKAVKNNYGRKKFIFKWDIEVPYQVEPEKVDRLVETLRGNLKEKPEVVQEFSFVYLDRIDKWNKVMRLWFQVRAPDFPASAAMGTRLLGEVQKIFEAEGVEPPSPTYRISLEEPAEGLKTARNG